MTNSLNLGHLRTIAAIAECGGFGKAAAVLHVSQPALSQHIRLSEPSLERKGARVEVAAVTTTLESVSTGARADLGIALLPSAGGRISGLAERKDLPRAGDVERAARSAGEEFFAARPVLQLVQASGRSHGRIG
ncbi:MAG: LysR family transcriptional regulator [Nocardioidaceae bacterium]